MPSKQSDAVRRHRAASRLAMVEPGFEAPDDESWGDLTAEPRGLTTWRPRPAGCLPCGRGQRREHDRVLMCIHGGGSSAARSTPIARCSATWPPGHLATWPRTRRRAALAAGQAEVSQDSTDRAVWARAVVHACRSS